MIQPVTFESVFVLLYRSDRVALSGSSLLQSHVVPFKHQIPVKACQHKHTDKKTLHNYDH